MKGNKTYNLLDKKISNLQFFYIVITLILTTADILPPSIVAALAGKDSWFSVILSTLAAMLLMAMYIKLASMYPDKNFNEYSVEIFGPVFGKLASILILYFLISVGSLILRELGEIMKTLFLNRTPIIVIVFIAMLVLVYGVYLGFESTTRVIELVFWGGQVLLAFVIALTLLPLADFSEYRPFFENGVMPSVKGGIFLLSVYSETIIVLLLYPSINNKKKTLMVGMVSILYLGVALMTGTIAITIFGVKPTSEMLFPALKMVSMINYAEFLQRLDSVVLALWVGGIMLKLLLFFGSANLTICQLMGLKDNKPTIIPLGVLFAALSLFFYSNVTDLFYYVKNSYVYTMFITVLVPFSLLIVALIKKGFKKT